MISSFLSFFATSQRIPEWAEQHIKPIDDLEDEDTLADVRSEKSNNDNDISGQSFGIEYISAKGEKSDRWISVINIIGKGENICLLAYCFVRERPRKFRLDRITTVYDADGIVADCAEFFGNFGLEFKSTPPPLQKSGAFLKREMKDEARLLVAVARIDGKYREEELEEILVYLVKKAENKGEFQSEEDIVAFEKYLRNLYPTTDVLDGCLKRVKKYTDRGKQDFLRMCTRVMDADGIQKQCEFNLILEIQAAIKE